MKQLQILLVFTSTLLLSCKKETPTPFVAGFSNSIRIVPNEQTLMVNDTFTVQAFYYNANNQLVENTTFNWLVSDPEILDINDQKVVTALKEGNATITASFNGVISNELLVNVQNEPTEVPATERIGTFSSRNGYAIRGDVKLVRTNNQITIEFQNNFSVQSGPDLVLYLSNADRVETSSLQLDEMKTYTGPLTFNTPLGTNLNDFSHVIVHCRRFNRTFGVAPLN